MAADTDGGERPGGATPELAPTLEREGQLSVEQTADDLVAAGELHLGRYKLLSLLGRGGMGVVYTAYDEMLDRVVALKMLRADRSGGAALGRFFREAKALARLSHPNIVPIHDVSVAGGQVFLAMEYVRGRTLREVLSRRSPGAGHESVLELFLQAGRGLQAVHRAGLVHRDFKPENVMVGEDGRVRVMDFGLVRRAQDLEPEAVPTSDGALDVNLTAFGAIVGTPAYMAPEQHRGAPVDARADVYSFCASLYEALYGQRPFPADSADQLRAAQEEEVQTPAGAKVPGWLRAVVVRGLQSEPTRRWPDMESLLAALAADPVAARRRRLRRIGVAALVAVLAVVGTSAVIGLRRRWAEARAEALAAEHLRAIEAEVGTGREEAAFSAFVDDPAHRDTRALVWAWQRRGNRERAAGATERALAAYARAFADAREPADVRAALRSLAEVYRATWRTEALGRAVSALEPDREDPELVNFMVDAALRRRDLAAADVLIADASDPALTGARPLIRALASARRVPGTALDAVALPRAGRLAAAVLRDDLHEVALLDRSLAVAQRFRSPDPIHLTPGGPWGLSRTGDTIRLLDLKAPERPLLTFPGSLDAYPVNALDVGGDGRIELFFLHQSPDRGFKVITDVTGAPAVRTAHEGSERTGSDFHALVAGDLDGDGTQEIVASFGGWRAYDLRVFHADDAGELRLVGRTQVGRVSALATLRRPGGGLALAAAVNGNHRNPAVFPDPPHVGAVPGVYLLEWTGSELVARARTRPPDVRSPEFVERPVVADLDGDGVDEFAVRIGQEGVLHTLVVRQTPDGGVSSCLIGHIGLLAALELDDDAASEVLALDRQTHELWALGVGGGALPPLSDAEPTPEPPPRWLGDEVLRRRWARAEVLGRVGLPGSAAAVLRDASALALDLKIRNRLLDRAAARFAAAGDAEAALALSARVEDDPELGPGALRRRIDLLTDLGRYPEAALAATALRDHPRRSTALAAAAVAALERLEPLLDASRGAEIRFDGPLSPAWQIERPIALRRDPVAGALRVEAVSTYGRLAALPVRWDGGPAQIEVEIEVERAEWFTRLAIDLVDAEGRPWFGVGAGAGGARHEHHHSALCRARGDGQLTNRPTTAAATRHRLLLQAVYFPDRGVVECIVDDEGRPRERVRLDRVAPLAPGPGSLVITGFGPDTTPHLVALDVRRISLRGVHVDASASGGDAVDGAAWALVEGEPGRALSALAGEPASPRRSALELLAYDDLRDASGVARTIDAGLPALDDDDVILLLRTRPALALASRQALGPRLLPLLARAWTELADKHQGDTELERSLLAELRGVEDTGPADASQRVDLAALLFARGQVHERGGDVARARRDYEAALAALGPVRAVDEESPRSGIHRALALLLARSDPDAARAHAAGAIASAAAPELMQDRLLTDERVADLAARDPAWRSLFGGPGRPSP